MRPFSLAFRNDIQALVAESFDPSAGKSAVSYHHVRNQTLTHNSRSVGNKQTDACWLVVTKNGRYAYPASFGSGTISSCGVAEDGPYRSPAWRSADG